MLVGVCTRAFKASCLHLLWTMKMIDDQILNWLLLKWLLKLEQLKLGCLSTKAKHPNFRWRQLESKCDCAKRHFLCWCLLPVLYSPNGKTSSNVAYMSALPWFQLKWELILKFTGTILQSNWPSALLRYVFEIFDVFSLNI